jgi:hypothetical protein
MALAFARVALPTAVVLFAAAALVARATEDQAIFALLLPAGLVIVARGALMLALREQVLQPLAAREEAGLGGRLGLRKEHPFGAVMLIAIGLVWSAVGVGAAFD